MTLEELQIRFTAQTAGLSSQLNGVKTQLAQVGGATAAASSGMMGMSAYASKAGAAMSGLMNYAKLFVGLYLGKKLIDLGRDSLTMANNVIESESLFAVSMKGMADDARAWSDNLSTSLGINAYEARKSAGIFNTMFASMGLGTKAAYDLSTGLTEAAYDMSSFYNVDAEDAFTKIRAGMTGEMEGLRRLGILMDVDTVKRYAMTEGISKTGKNMTTSQTIMARYAALMAQMGDAHGDLARTIASPVNQIRVLNNTFDQAKIALGQAFQPIQAIVLPILMSLANTALVAARALGAFTSAIAGLLGIKVASAVNVDAKSTDKLAAGLYKTADAYKAAGGAAKKAAKDAKVGLRAFDEINKLSEADKPGSGANGLTEAPEIVNPGAAGSLSVVSAAMADVSACLKKLWDKAEPLRVSLSTLRESLKKFGSLVWDNLVWFYDKFLVPIGKWAVGKAVPAFLDALSDAVDLVNTAIAAAGPALGRFYSNVLVPLVKWAADSFIEALDWMKKRFEELGAWISNNQGKYDTLVKAIFSLAAGITVAWAATKLVSGISAAMVLLTSPMGALTLIGAALVALALNWDDVKAAAIKAFDDLVKAADDIVLWIKEWILGPILAGIQAIIDTIKAAGGVVLWIKDRIIDPNAADVTTGATNNLRELDAIIFGHAKGGVFQPNTPHLAILGDQKHGRNIETPERLLRDMFRAEIRGVRVPSMAFASSFDGNNDAAASRISRAVEQVLDNLGISLDMNVEKYGMASVRTINDVQRRAGKLLLEM